MKRFGSLLLAAVLGSGITIGTYEIMDKGERVVRLDYSSGVPAAQVAYHVNEAGEIVPLDFTETAAKVTSAGAATTRLSSGMRPPFARRYSGCT